MEAPDRLDSQDEPYLPIVTRWLDFSTWLLQTTGGFPKHLRHSLVHRLDSEALEILSLLTDACYRQRKAGLLPAANQSLNRLRVLLELSHRLGGLSHNAHEHSLVATAEFGRMLGGWLRHARGREAGRRSPSTNA